MGCQVTLSAGLAHAVAFSTFGLAQHITGCSMLLRLNKTCSCRSLQRLFGKAYRIL